MRSFLVVSIIAFFQLSAMASSKHCKDFARAVLNGSHKAKGEGKNYRQVLFENKVAFRYEDYNVAQEILPFVQEGDHLLIQMEITEQMLKEDFLAQLKITRQKTAMEQQKLEAGSKEWKVLNKKMIALNDQIEEIDHTNRLTSIPRTRYTETIEVSSNDQIQEFFKNKRSTGHVVRAAAVFKAEPPRVKKGILSTMGFSDFVNKWIFGAD